jgi:hypothetical protein
MAPDYDPVKAHEYYEKHKHLKGRKTGASQQPADRRIVRHLPNARHKQKIELQNSIQNLQAKLGKLEDLIKKKEEILKKDKAQAKVRAKKKDKPATAADKAKAARESKQYRQKHKQELKTKEKQAAAKSGGGSSKSSGTKSHKKPSDMSIADLKALATKVKGQIAVAKQKLAAL